MLEDEVLSEALTRPRGHQTPDDISFEGQINQLQAHYRSLQRLRDVQQHDPGRHGSSPSLQAGSEQAESWEDRVKRLKEQDRRAAAEQAAKIRDNRERGQQGLLRSLKSVRQWAWPQEQQLLP